MKILQFVMAYGVEQDRLRAILPDGFESLRPVLRINAEIVNDKTATIQLNTAVQKDNLHGWLNIQTWQDVPYKKQDDKTTFANDIFTITFASTGIQGGCPAEKANDGTFFLQPTLNFIKNEKITSNKTFCNCTFCFATPLGAHGKSLGKTLPATPEPILTIYPKQQFTLQNATCIPCKQVLGSYMVEFERE